MQEKDKNNKSIMPGETAANDIHNNAATPTGTPLPDTTKPEKAPAPTAPEKTSSSAALVGQTQEILLKMVSSLQRPVNDAVELGGANKKIPARVAYNALGQLFYRVGTQAEYTLIKIWRALCFVAVALLRTAGALCRVAGRFFGKLALSFWQDIKAPFVQVHSGIKHIRQLVREEKASGSGRAAGKGFAYFISGVREYRHLLFGALSYLLPVAAAFVFAFTVHQVMNSTFALQVQYNGQVIGFVENEQVWERAQSIVKDRIRNVDTDEQWDAYPVLAIQMVDKAALSRSTELADKLISTSQEKIQNAVGVYVDDALIGVTLDGATVQDAVDAVIAPYQQPENPNVRVEFVHEIDLVPGVYFTSTIRNSDEVAAALTSSADYMQIKTMETRVYNVISPFEVIEEENANMIQGWRKTTQEGVEGVDEVTAEVTSINGIEVKRVVINRTSLVPSMAEIVSVGTKEAIVLGHLGSGSLSFPVPDYSYMTTQFGQGGHRGTDICAPTGTPIYACDAGTVTEAGWHGSWGNYIKIDHGNGMTTLYGHCSALLVDVGTIVAAGQEIALVGNTGNSSGSHCHLEMTIGGTLINPLEYVSP